MRKYGWNIFNGASERECAHRTHRFGDQSFKKIIARHSGGLAVERTRGSFIRRALVVSIFFSPICISSPHQHFFHDIASFSLLLSLLLLHAMTFADRNESDRRSERQCRVNLYFIPLPSCDSGATLSEQLRGSKPALVADKKSAMAKFAYARAVGVTACLFLSFFLSLPFSLPRFFPINYICQVSARPRLFCTRARASRESRECRFTQNRTSLFERLSAGRARKRKRGAEKGQTTPHIPTFTPGAGKHII